MTRPFSTGLLHWIFPAMLALIGLGIFMSGRDLSVLFLDLSQTGPSERPALVAWFQRGVSLLLLLAAAEQIANHFALKRRTPSPLLLIAFLTYWLGTIGSAAVFGAHPQLSHELLYALATGTACCLVHPPEREHIIRIARNSLFALMVAGVLLIPLRMNLVMDMSYSQGLIPGLPRFGGLTPHPVGQGMMAQIALLLLWSQPYERRWLNRCAWLLGLGVLFVAQSKTAWGAFAACAMVMWAVRHGGHFWRRVGDPRGSNGFGILVCLAVIVSVLGIATWMLVGDALGRAASFAGSRDGAELMSLTGRDRIWAAALDEWRHSPVFGYGLSLWDAAYRASIGMPQATHAHNQFLDDLARSGYVGATALVLYAAALLVLSLRHARTSGGLSLALFLAVALRSVSEVPLSLLGYGTELFTHLLLLATLASAASERRETVVRAAPLRYGVAS